MIQLRDYQIKLVDEVRVRLEAFTPKAVGKTVRFKGTDTKIKIQDIYFCGSLELKIATEGDSDVNPFLVEFVE